MENAAKHVNVSWRGSIFRSNETGEKACIARNSDIVICCYAGLLRGEGEVVEMVNGYGGGN